MDGVYDIANLSSKRKGNIGEAAILKRFVDRGIPVYIPFGTNTDADLLADFDGKLQKIQVKSSSQTAKWKNSGRTFPLKHTEIHVKDGAEVAIARTYKTSDVDYFALHDLVTGESFLVNNHEDIKSIITIRYTEPSPEQGLQHYNLASDYEFDHVLDLIEDKNVIDAEYTILDD